MKNRSLLLSLLTAFLLLVFVPRVQAQDEMDKYKVVQGIGYLHTQVTLIIEGWDVHPLNHKPVDEMEAAFQNHMIQEYEHDEEWAQFLLVDDIVLDHFGEFLDADEEDALNYNLDFYNRVIKALENPEVFPEEEFKEDLEMANEYLYDMIYPALIN